jgi:hypothetical protein
MEIKTTRTLVKSAPELWELLDDEPWLRHCSARLCDGDGTFEVLTRKPERRLVWRSDGSWTATVEVSLAEKGFGTQVAITVEAEDGLRQSILDEVIDELAEPQRRPFTAA